MATNRLILLTLCFLLELPSFALFGLGGDKVENKKLDAIKLEDQKLEGNFKPQELSPIEKKRAELKANEERALNFIFASENPEQEEISSEKYFSQTEKEQLLELWRATIARNRTIQFIIKVLSTNPDDLEQNNAVMQVISRALFVPFYAVSAIAENSLVSGGSAVGARVIGDVVDAKNKNSARDQEITNTEIMVLFMLVDEVAQRLRSAYSDYKSLRVEKKFIDYELEGARIDAGEAMQLGYQESIFFTRMAVRDVERDLRANRLALQAARRDLIELSGEKAVDSVDLLIDMEAEKSLALN